MQETEPTQNLDRPNSGARLLDKDAYRVYSIEDTSQTTLFIKLAQLVARLDRESNGVVLVESLSPRPYEEGDEYIFTLLVTVSI